MSADACVDGIPARSVDVADRGLHYGDGVFETITCVDGAPRWLERHLDRLRAGCERLELSFVGGLDLARAEVRAMAAGSTRCIVKLIVTRGIATERGYGFSGRERATRIVTRHPWPVASIPARARIDRAHIALGDQPRLAGLKHLNRLEQVLASREARTRGFDELLLCGTDDRLISGTMTNVFLMKDGVLITPRLDRAGVAGVMRGLVLEQAVSNDWRVAERDVNVHEAYEADEIFMTNVRVGLWQVGEFAGRRFRGAAAAAALASLCGAIS